MAKYFSLLILLFSLSETLWAQEGEWLDRLFYVKGKSLVRQGPFFLTPNGQHHPQKELEASLELMRNDPRSFACKFPGRFTYLAKRLGIPTESMFCDEFLSWRESFEARSLSLMFASQYLENPASSFGHTYLKVNSENKSLYLNKVISFAAAVPLKVGGPEYIWKGLTGGFEGAFSESPFYILFQEYANMEKRDLYEYELKFSKEETYELLAVLYELIQYAKFDYLFLSENCSSLLLRLLEIKAQKSLLKELPFYVIPIETVKALEREGLIGKTIFHPSITSRMLLQAKKLKAQEIKEFTRSLDGEKLNPKSSAGTLDLGLEYLNFKRQKNAGFLSPEDKKDFAQYLLYRSGHKEKFEPVTVPVLDPIKASHPQRLTLGAQITNEKEKGISLTYRPAGKDFYDRPHGYAKESEINLFRTKLFIDTEDLKTSWFNLDVLGVRKYADYNLITKNTSWGANIAVKNLANRGCSKCYFTEIDSAIGLGKNVLQESILTYALLHPTLRVGKVTRNFLPQLEVGLIRSIEEFILKTSAFAGDSFQESRNTFSYILSHDLSLNFQHEYVHQEKSWNSFQTELSIYY